MGQLHGGGPFTEPFGQSGFVHAALQTMGPSAAAAASEMLPASPPSGGGAHVAHSHGDGPGTMPYGQLGSMQAMGRQAVVPPAPPAPPLAPPAAPPAPPTFPPTPPAAPPAPPTFPPVPPAMPPMFAAIPPPPIVPPMVVVFPPLPLFAVPPLPPLALAVLPPLPLLAPWPPSPSPESFVQATMNAQPERRLTKIVDVLRIESSKISLGLPEASLVPLFDAGRRDGIPPPFSTEPRRRLRILRRSRACPPRWSATLCGHRSGSATMRLALDAICSGDST